MMGNNSGLLGHNVEWNAKSIFNFEDLSPTVSSHLRKVFVSLFGLCVVASVGVYLHLLTNFGGILTALASIGFLIAVASTRHEGASSKRMGFVAAFGALKGMSIGPLISMVLKMEDGASLILTAFVGAALVFACLAGAAAVSPRRSFLWITGILSVGLIALLFMGLLNLFIRSPALFNLHLYLGLFVFCGFVLVDTQMVVERYHYGDHDVLGHSVDLFIDFVAIFVRLLIILSKKKKENK